MFFRTFLIAVRGRKRGFWVGGVGRDLVCSLDFLGRLDFKVIWFDRFLDFVYSSFDVVFWFSYICVFIWVSIVFFFNEWIW